MGLPRDFGFWIREFGSIQNPDTAATLPKPLARYCESNFDTRSRCRAPTLLWTCIRSENGAGIYRGVIEMRGVNEPAALQG